MRYAQGLVMTIDATKNKHRNAWLCGLTGMLGFSLTLPMTRLAIVVFDPIVVGLGRALIAAVLAAIALGIGRQKIPPRKYWWRFMIVGAGVVIGFPLLSSIAMRSVPATHGAVIVGFIPIVTAWMAKWRGGEKLSVGYWAFSLSGALLVIVFVGKTDGLTLHTADIALLGAAISAGVGYAEGALLARSFGHWQTICWALLISAPLASFLLTLNQFSNHAVVFTEYTFNSSTWASWAALGYVSCISMFAAFMLWYRGLALGGIAQVGQIQLLQPFVTMLAAACWFGERWQPDAPLFALAIMILIILSRYSAVRGFGKREKFA